MNEKTATLNEKCVAFIDLLEFSKFVENYDMDSIREFFNSIEPFVNPASFAYLENSFETFLVSSDSILITAKKEDANIFIDAICSFFKRG